MRSQGIGELGGDGVICTRTAVEQCVEILEAAGVPPYQPPDTFYFLIFETIQHWERPDELVGLGWGQWPNIPAPQSIMSPIRQTEPEARSNEQVRQPVVHHPARQQRSDLFVNQCAVRIQIVFKVVEHDQRGNVLEDVGTECRQAISPRQRAVGSVVRRAHHLRADTQIWAQLFVANNNFQHCIEECVNGLRAGHYHEQRRWLLACHELTRQGGFSGAADS